MNCPYDIIEIPIVINNKLIIILSVIVGTNIEKNSVKTPTNKASKIVPIPIDSCINKSIIKKRKPVLPCTKPYDRFVLLQIPTERATQGIKPIFAEIVNLLPREKINKPIIVLIILHKNFFKLLVFNFIIKFYQYGRK